MGENIMVGAALWIKENWTEERPVRIGALSADMPIHRSAYSVAGEYMIEQGIEWVGVEFSPIVGMLDSSVELLRLANKGADWLLISHYGANGAVIAKDAARLGLKEKINFVGDVAALDEGVLRVAGKSAEGFYKQCLQPTAFMAEGNPGLKTVLEAAKRYRGADPEDITMFYITGWHAAMITIEGIRLAIEQAGFENLTGRAIRDGLFSIQDFDTGLGLPDTITEEDLLTKINELNDNNEIDGWQVSAETSTCQTIKVTAR